MCLRFLVRVSYLEIYNEEVRDLLGKDQNQRLEVGIVAAFHWMHFNNNNNKRTNMLILAPVISLSPLPLRPWEFSMHLLASSWLILEEESQLILPRLERPVFCFRGFLFWCSASMLFCCTTVCRPLTAQTDDHTHLCIV